MKLKNMWGVLVDVVKKFGADNITTQAAALGFFTIFSIAPVLIIVAVVAGAFFGEQAAQQEIANQLRQQIGDGPTEVITRILGNARKSPHSALAITISIITVVVGATGVFSQLQNSLNMVWDVTAKPGGNAVLNFLRRRLMTFVMVLTLGVLLLGVQFATAMLAFVQKNTNYIPGQHYLWQIANLGISFFVMVMLFAAIYKILPDVHMKWRYVWLGSTMTAILFVVGRYFIGMYLSKASVTSTYGAAGSLVVILLWFYYSSIIFFLGAEFIHALAKRRNVEIRPNRFATRRIVTNAHALEQELNGLGGEGSPGGS